MKAHLRYLQYVVRHKWYVFLECCNLGILWLGIIHDASKFLPCEWFPYVHSFFNPDGSPRKRRDQTGAYDPAKISKEFDLAWLHHQKNRHHWTAWVLIGDGGTLKPILIPDRYRREMLADWYGAGRAQGKPDTKGWYQHNQDKMLLHPGTRAWIEDQLGVRQE